MLEQQSRWLQRSAGAPTDARCTALHAPQPELPSHLLCVCVVACSVCLVGDRSSEAFDTSATGVGAYGVLPPSALYDTTGTTLDTRAQYQMVYYEQSELSFEWTNQHGCGGNEATDPQKLNC